MKLPHFFIAKRKKKRKEKKHPNERIVVVSYLEITSHKKEKEKKKKKHPNERIIVVSYLEITSHKKEEKEKEKRTNKNKNIGDFIVIFFSRATNPKKGRSVGLPGR